MCLQAKRKDPEGIQEEDKCIKHIAVFCYFSNVILDSTLQFFFQRFWFQYSQANWSPIFF